MYLKGRERQRPIIYWFIPKISKTAVAKLKPGVRNSFWYQFRWQGPKSWSHCLLPPRVRISRKLALTQSQDSNPIITIGDVGDLSVIFTSTPNIYLCK